MSDKGKKRFIDTFVKKRKPAKRIVLDTYVETLPPAPEHTRPSATVNKTTTTTSNLDINLILKQF